MQETGIIILLIALFFIWILICVKLGIGRIGKIVSVLMLFGVLTLIKLSIPSLQQEQSHSDYAADNTLSQGSDNAFSEEEDWTSGFTEDKERNRREGILYTIDDAEKVTLTSHSGEICVKIPRWNGFSAEWTEGPVGYERCHMTNENYDSMDYELVASWNPEQAEKEIIEDFGRHYNRDNVLGDVYHMTVDGIEIYYRPCYEFVHSQSIDWHYMVWADLGCGQFLTTEFHEGVMSDEARSRAYDYEIVPREVTEPLHIEGVIEALYSNIEVCTLEGDPIRIAYREPLFEEDEEAYYDFSFGIAREYKTDEYREAAVCAELIESLYQAVQEGDIQELLHREAIAEKELSIAEKMDYIKKEETGTLIKYDAGHTYIREGSYPPTKYYLVKGADASEEFLVYRGYNYWEDLYSYMWFPCKKDDTGAIRAQRGIYVYGADTQEHYLLSFQGNPYLCIANRNSQEKIESVVLYDFATPDLIGTVIHIDASSVRICSYVRNEGSYGTEKPWCLYNNKIDAGREFFFMLEAWRVTEFLGESDALRVEDTGSAAYESEQKRTQELVNAYLGQEINMSWDRKKHDVKTFQSASVYGYYYTSPENLYKVYRQPQTLAMEAPICVATMQTYDFEEQIDILIDKNDKAAICVDGRFFLLEKGEEETEELRTWE